MEVYNTKYRKNLIFIITLLVFLTILGMTLLKLFSDNFEETNESKSIEVLSPIKFVAAPTNQTTATSFTSKKTEFKDSRSKINKIIGNNITRKMETASTVIEVERRPNQEQTESKSQNQIDSKIENTDNPSIYTDTQRKIDINKPMVALTFDDGPHPKSTSRILDALEKYNAVATFFDLGYRISLYPKIVKREAALGCEIGNHTYNHKDLTLLSKKEMLSEINKTNKALKKILGYKANLVRPPYGSVNKRVLSTIEYPLISWSVDTLDWESKDTNSILEEIDKVKKLDGRIILMHSLYESTADAVEILIPSLIEKGYQLVTVSEIIKYKHNTELKPGVFYRY